MSANQLEYEGFIRAFQREDHTAIGVACEPGGHRSALARRANSRSCDAEQYQ